MHRVGCCGVAMAQRTYYETFSLIEIQKTFYHPPKPETADRWRAEAPGGFEFTVKAWQLLTHEASSPTYRRLRRKLSERETRDVGSFRWNDTTRRAWETTLDVARRLEADKILFQCPASFVPSAENEERLRTFFSEIDREGIICLWEPRGEWTRERIGTHCDELDLVHCVDPFDGLPWTEGLRYFRLHGVGGYHHRYTDAELERLADLAEEGAPVYFLFNNVAMREDAESLLERI